MPDGMMSVIHAVVDLNKTISKTVLRDLFVTEDKRAHAFDVQITRAGEPVDLTGATVTGYFMRYKDRTSIPLTGSVQGANTARLVLSDDCYALSTLFAVTVCVTLGEVKHAVYLAEGQMSANRTDAIVDPSGVIPSLEDILAQYELMSTGTNAANAAAADANAAAGSANTATGNANTAASAASTAADRANAAAEALETAPVPAGTVVTYQAGESATVQPTGEWLADVPAVPQGQYLWTRTVQSFTNGAPVTSYSVARQGMDGSGSVSSVNGVSPDATGNIALTAADVGARPDNWMPTAADVGARPDNWMPTAADVGALPSDGTAVNSEQLGGKAPEYYEKNRNLLKNRKVICIGDSYNYNAANWNGWGYYLDTLFPYLTVYSYALPGGGFVTEAEGHIFADGLEQAASEISEKNEITDIVVMGGYNDASMSVSTESLDAAFEAFKTKCSEHFLNAKVSIAFIGADCRFNGMQERCLSYARYYEQCAQRVGFAFIPNMNYILLNRSYILDVSGDANSGFHPNNTGNQEIARQLAEWLSGGVPHVKYGEVAGVFQMYLEDGQCTMCGMSGANPPMFAYSGTLSNGIWYDLMDLGSVELLWGKHDGASFAWHGGAIAVHGTTGAAHVLNLRYLHGKFQIMYNAGASLDMNGIFGYFPTLSAPVDVFY